MYVLVTLGCTFFGLQVIHFEKLGKKYLEHITPNGVAGTVMHAVAKVDIISSGGTPFVLSRGFITEAFSSTNLVEPEAVPLVWMMQPGIAKVGGLNGHFENCAFGKDDTVWEGDSLVDSFH
jgi:hypothetical protein